MPPTLPEALALLRRRTTGEVVPVCEALSVVALWLAEREGNRHVVPLDIHDAPFLPHEAAAECARRISESGC